MIPEEIAELYRALDPERIALEYPQLHPREHAMLESFLGRSLTNAEAQEALRDATLLAAFTVWCDRKGF